jgi:DNA repair protein RecO (recombination protein O)
MKWIDTGFLISKNKYNENSVIAEIFTLNNGKTTGIIFGASSKKIKSYLEIGNLLHVNYSSKSSEKIGSFKIEISKVNTAYFFENKIKLHCILSTMNLIKILTVENQSNKNLYNLINNFFENIKLDKWLKEYILWELEFYKVLGYNLNLKDLVQKEEQNGTTNYFVISNNEKKNIPSFLVNEKTQDQDINKDDLFNAIKILNNFLEKSILRPSNIHFPHERLTFLSNLN